MKRLIFILMAVAILIVPTITEGQNQITRPKKKTEQELRKKPSKQNGAETQATASSKQKATQPAKKQENTPVKQPKIQPAKQQETQTGGHKQSTSPTLRVRDFLVLPNDQTASESSTKKLDWNNKPAALIKIKTELEPNQTLFDVTAGIVARENKDGEIWIYVPGGTSSFLIKNRQYGSLKYYFEEEIKLGHTYSMRLVVE